MMKCYRQILYSRPHQCQLPCTHESYKGKTRKMGKSFENKIVNYNEMYIRLTYTTTDTEIHDEVLIQDLSTFIGTVGGSLGLFIGFSYTGFIGNIVDYIFTFQQTKNSFIPLLLQQRKSFAKKQGKILP